MPTGERIKGGVEKIVGKTIVAAEGYIGGDTLGLRFNDGSYCYFEARSDCDCDYCTSSIEEGEPNGIDLYHLGVITMEEGQAIIDREESATKARRCAGRRAEYERLKAEFGDTKE